MKILISNDDGIMSPGIHILAETLNTCGEVTVVAPSQERSATAHSLTLHKPLRLHIMKPEFYHVNGTPADCVYLALKKICRDKKPDIVFSGINCGANLGYDVHYSGTVAAAREAAIMNIPSVAVSLSTTQEDPHLMNYRTAALYARRLAELIQKNGLPHGVFLNVNVPDRPLADIQGVKFVRTGVRVYSDEIEEKKDPRGKSYFWLGGGYIGYKDLPDTDCRAIENGYVTITPLHVDATEHSFLSVLKEWNIENV